MRNTHDESTSSREDFGCTPTTQAIAIPGSVSESPLPDAALQAFAKADEIQAQENQRIAAMQARHECSDRLYNLSRRVDGAYADRETHGEAKLLAICEAMVTLWTELRNQGFEPYFDQLVSQYTDANKPGFGISVELCRLALGGKRDSLRDVLRKAIANNILEPGVFRFVLLNWIGNQTIELREKDEHNNRAAELRERTAAAQPTGTQPVAAEPGAGANKAGSPVNTSTPAEPEQEKLRVLRAFAANLAKVRRRVLELVIENDYQYPLKDMAVALEWGGDWKSAWNSAKKELNKELAKAKLPYHLFGAVVAKLKEGHRPKKPAARSNPNRKPKVSKVRP